MRHVSSYSTIYALGHRAITDIISSPVVVEEKVDGSQFSMQRLNGELACRSKGQDLIPGAPEKMFSRAVMVAEDLDLHDGWIYRCEYLQSPKHNTLAYGRIPRSHLVVYDIETGPQCFLTPTEKAEECARIGLECVPLYFEGMISSLADLQTMLERDSMLGSVKIEGVVIKNYAMFTADKKVAMAKLVCAGFAEKNQKEFRSANPRQGDVMVIVIDSLKTEARWQKAVQHLRERGILTDSLKDIGPLIKEAQADILKEEKEWIAEQFLKWAMPNVLRGAISGLPEWYKEQLAQKAFEPVSN